MKDADDPFEPVDARLGLRKTLRSRAEERLESLKDPELEALGPEETKELVHKLRVHQVELEIQNEELRRAQDEVSLAQARYFDLYDMAPVGYCTLDEKGLILESNLTAAALLGVVREALVKKPFSKVVLKEDQDIYYLHLLRLVETGIPQAFELRLRNADTTFWARLNITTLRDGTNTPVFRVVLSDITEHKKAVEDLRQSELRESENRFRKLFIQHSAVMLILDPGTGRIIDANKAAVRFYGWSLDELRKMSISDINTLPPETVRAFLVKVTESEGASFEFRHRRADGSIREVEVFSNEIESGEKTFIFSIIHDITDRRQAENLLQEKERYLSTILQTTVDGFWVVDAQGKIIQANKACCRMLGYTYDQLLKLDVFALDAVETPSDTLERIQKIIANGSEIFETRHRRKDGSFFSVEISATYMVDPTGGKFVCFCRDITERRQAEEQLKDMNSELEKRVEERTRELQETQSQFLHAEKLSAIGKLSASIAHEFNNPLQGIMSILNGLQKRAILEEEDRELLYAAICETERMKNLIRSLQDFNRPSPGKKVVVDVQKSLDSLLTLCKNDFKAKRISTVLNYAEQIPHIMAVPDQIKQVFLNLLTNAADACHQRGGVITISTWQEENKVAVGIKDTGTGISSGNIDLIFQPFYTTKAEVKGTGLGLSICHGIVEQHHGEIRVKSTPGEGTTFTVLLPVKGE